MGNFNVRIGFGILQFDIIFGIILLDQRIFKRQRFDLGIADNIIEIVHRHDHLMCFEIFRTVLKILRHAVFELA